MLFDLYVEASGVKEIGHTYPRLIHSSKLDIRYAMLLYIHPSTRSSPLTPPQPNRLSIFLQLGNQRIPLLDDVCILLVFIVGAVGFNDTVYAVDGTGDAICGYEFGEISMEVLVISTVYWGKMNRIRTGQESQLICQNLSPCC